MAEAPSSSVNTDRTAKVCARLRELYQKSILPVEKKYRYDYFFDSPLLSDVEFDGMSSAYQYKLQIAFSQLDLSAFSETPSFTRGTVFGRQDLVHSILARS
jgi:N-terminal EH-domain containing protein